MATTHAAPNKTRRGVQSGAEINHSDYQTVSSAEGIVGTNLSIQSRIKLYDVVEALSGSVLLQMSEWLANQQNSPFQTDNDAEITKSRWITAQFIRDHSEKSFKVERADIIYSGFVLASDIDSTVVEQISSITDHCGEVYYSLDNTDSKYIDNVGGAYLPKTHVDNLYIIEQ